MARRVLALVLGWLLLWSAASAAQAQSTTAQASDALDHAQSEIRTVWQTAKRSQDDDAALSRLQVQLPPIQAEISTTVDPLRSQLAAADARLTTLGPPPKPGTPPEAPAIAQDRKAQTALRTALDAQVKRGDLLLVESQQLADKLAGMRVDAFTRRVGERSKSVLNPALWGAAALEAPHDLARWGDLLKGQAQAVRKAAAPRAFGAAVLAALIAALLAAPSQLMLLKLLRRLVAASSASERLRRAALATGGVLIRTVLPTAAVGLLVGTLSSVELLSPEMQQLAWAIVRAVGFIAAASALGAAVLAPHQPEQRLLPIGDGSAAALSPYPPLLGATLSLGILALEAVRAAGAGLAASVAVQALVALANLVAIVLTVSAVSRTRAAEHAARAEEGLAETDGGVWAGVWSLTLSSAWLAIAAGLLALGLGYIAFAVFLAREMVWIAMVGALLFLLVSLTDAFFAELASSEGPVGRFVAHALGVGSKALDQLAVLLTGFARVVLWLLAWAAILIPFGAGAGDVLTHLQESATSFRLGGVTVAPAAIAAAMGLFLLGVFVTRLFRSWLETQYLPHTRLDKGLSATVATGVSYVGGLAALLIASAYLGLKLTQVTLIASALTVGVGFGLQSVIQNFVAGLILLAGRPIRVGDWISVGGQEGDVQRINVRATEIKLFDGSVLVLPNSELVTKPVRNVTWGSPLGQVQVTFTLGYDVDLDKAGAILLEALKQTKGVLKEPAPHVAVTEFHDTGATLRGVASVATPRLVYRIKSDILFDLARRLRAAGIRPGVDPSQAAASAVAKKAAP